MSMPVSLHKPLRTGIHNSEKQIQFSNRSPLFKGSAGISRQGLGEWQSQRAGRTPYKKGADER